MLQKLRQYLVDSATARLTAIEMVDQHGKDAYSILDAEIGMEDSQSRRRALLERTRREVARMYIR